jgi:hypothetical protein
MKTVILPTRNKSNSFFFLTLTVAPSVGLFSKLATKPTKPIISSFVGKLLAVASKI